MLFAFLLGLAAVVGATLLTYLYDRDALLWSRLCAGACVGFAALGLFGFVAASFVGMTPAALVVAGALAASPLLLLLEGERRALVATNARESVRVARRAVAHPRAETTVPLALIVVAALVFWFVFDGAMYETGEGVFTSFDTNIGDLPFHVAIISGFAHGENFPPEHPEFAGVKLTYPFIVDFTTALFVRAGASLRGALFWQNYLTMLALAGLLYRWASKLTRSVAASLITPVVILLSGGLGWWAFLGEASEGGGGILSHLGNLTHDYTIMRGAGYAWGNAVTSLFVTQRGMVLGLGLALIAWTLWWQATHGAEEETKGNEQRGRGKGEGGRVKGERARGKGEGKKSSVEDGGRRKEKTGRAESVAVREGRNEDLSAYSFPLSPFPFALATPFSRSLSSMAAAGFAVGLLPLVHAHSFVVMMGMGGCLMLLLGWLALSASPGVKGKGDAEGRASAADVVGAWGAFFVTALVVAAPQLLWATSGSAVRASEFFGWETGWGHGDENVVWFWVKNTAVFLPLLALALAWRGDDAPVPARLVYFYLPFTLCFILPNLFRLSPWIWDNIKVLFYWWVASSPLVALVLARIWKCGGWLRVVALCLLFAQTAAGALDVWRGTSGAVAHKIFDADDISFAEMLKRETEQRSLILHAPTYNVPVYLTGRRAFLGYPGHLMSHGLDYAEREAELKRIYAGAPDAASLLARNHIDYVVVGPQERAEMQRAGVWLDERFFERFEKVGETGGFRLYKTRP